jgi:hypothetical protein
MNYRKPEVAVLGQAASIIQGAKPHKPDAGSSAPGNVTDCELDD